MPAQDPIFNVMNAAITPGHSQGLLAFIRSAAIAAGWVIDEYDTSPVWTTESGGHELYMHPNVPSLSSAPYFSLKAFRGDDPDQTSLMVWMNTGYDASKRVDNQPGMVARTFRWPSDAALVDEVFSGLWDGAGAKADPGDTGRYLTKAYDGAYTGSMPFIPNTSVALHGYLTSSISQAWAFYDVPAFGGSSRSLIVIWYIDDTMYGIVMGNVLYDDEGVSPFDSDGFLLGAWSNIFANRSGTSAPKPNSLGLSRNGMFSNEGPLGVVRQSTVGAETYPSGSPDGVPLQESALVVVSLGRIEASNGPAGPFCSALVRPDQTFEQVHNGLQGSQFPNPKITIHKEPIVGSMTQERLGFARPRVISRFPDGGGFGSGNYAAGGGVHDWSDSGYSLPWYFACTRGRVEGDVVSEGSRQMQVFPGNRNGVDLNAAHRTAGIAIRIA